MRFTEEATPEAQAEFARERAAALRTLADLIEAKPDLAGSPYSEVCLNLWPSTADETVSLVRQLGGHREKLDHGKLLTVRRDLGARVVVDVVSSREQVCDAVVVGTERVEVPDPEAPKVTVERDVIEWVCSPLLDVG